VDSPATFVAQAGTPGAYGTFAINAAGNWTYTASSAHNEFVAGTTYTDSFDVASADGTHTSVTIHILGTNDAPTITSNGGGNTATVSVAENSTAVATVHATDPDSGAPTYSIIGGADAALFTINSTTGALSFIAAPNFEASADADHNNSYLLQV